MEKKELLAPVPSASDYSVSSDLWERLESEISAVSTRIEAGEELVPEDVVTVRKLKTQVDGYVTGFNKAMRDAMDSYKKMVARRLTELGFDNIEQFIAKKRREQSAEQDARIASKMEMLKTISDAIIGHTARLKDMAVAKEMLPAFVARFPKVQSGAKSNDISDWKPYFNIMSHAVMVMDTFFGDPAYADASLLPIYSGTIRELLAYARDGKPEHLEAVKVRYQEDMPLIQKEKLKQSLKTKDDGLRHIRHILEDIQDIGSLSEGARRIRTERAWSEISDIVRLVNEKD